MQADERSNGKRRDERPLRQHMGDAHRISEREVSPANVARKQWSRDRELICRRHAGSDQSPWNGASGVFSGDRTLARRSVPPAKQRDTERRKSHTRSVTLAALENTGPPLPG